MNTCQTPSSLQSRLAPARPGAREPFGSLGGVIDTAGLVSVDLTDTVFVSPSVHDTPPERLAAVLQTRRPARARAKWFWLP